MGISDSPESDNSATRLRSYIERVERLNAEIKDLNTDKSDIFKEARGTGFDVPSMREVIRLRAMETDKREERIELVDLYFRTLQNGTGLATHERTEPKQNAVRERTGHVPEPSVSTNRPIDTRASGPVAEEACRSGVEAPADSSSGGGVEGNAGSENGDFAGMHTPMPGLPTPSTIEASVRSSAGIKPGPQEDLSSREMPELPAFLDRRPRPMPAPVGNA